MWVMPDIRSRLLTALQCLQSRRTHDIEIIQRIQPVVDITSDLIAPTTEAGYMSADIHAANVILFTVPMGKRYRLRYLSRMTAVLGTTTEALTGVRFAGMYPQPMAAGTRYYSSERLDFWLDPGDELTVYNSGNAGDTGIVYRWLYQEVTTQ